MERGLLGVVREVAAAFKDLGIDYVIGGSLAAGALGVPRSTNGADLVADVQAQHVEALVAALEPRFYADAAMLRDAIGHTGSFNLIHYETAYKVDVFVCGGDAFRRAQIHRATRQHVQDLPLPFLSPEDIVLAKLLWYRLGGEVSERQWRDVLEVLAVHTGRLDEPYLFATARSIGVTDLLQRAMAAS